jgi:hypothetical protein
MDAFSGFAQDNRQGNSHGADFADHAKADMPYYPSWMRMQKGVNQKSSSRLPGHPIFRHQGLL